MENGRGKEREKRGTIDLLITFNKSSFHVTLSYCFFYFLNKPLNVSKQFVLLYSSQVNSVSVTRVHTAVCGRTPSCPALPMMTLVKARSSPLFSWYTMLTKARFAAGFPTGAPWMRSFSVFTRKLLVFSASTKLMASMRFDLPERGEEKNAQKTENAFCHFFFQRRSL